MTLLFRLRLSPLCLGLIAFIAILVFCYFSADPSAVLDRIGEMLRIILQ